MTESNEVYIVGYKRSAFSRSRPSEPERDFFNNIRMDEVLGMLIRSTIKETGIREGEISDVITGCALQADENWTYGGRHPAFMAGLPFNVTSMSLDRACSSSLNAVTIGAMEIMTENADIVMAGGMEHMTHMPLSNNPYIKPNMKLLLRPEFAKYQMSTSYSMGLTAEKLAEKSSISREDMDKFSYESHVKAKNAQERKFLSKEILPIKVEYQGSEKVIDEDQSIRKDATIEGFTTLKPAFKEGGRITAGNSSPLNAGASVVALMSGKKVKEYGIKPLAKISSFAWAGVDPSIMGEGPVPASKKAIEKAGLKADDIDLWEINEAFAVVALNAMKAFNIPREKINVNGGAIAIGHPLGASGARLAGTLSNALADTGKNIGLATLCVGGGQGFSTILERV
ncbi:acetyl-CoA acetyltransferase [mine drainage metagenome]|uniref:Acetyl-CoA acetyltransferase n=2 Tax=mine drainage metagenome TaxID=410659 RepID=T1AYW3_9ZZZZ